MNQRASGCTRLSIGYYSPGWPIGMCPNLRPRCDAGHGHRGLFALRKPPLGGSGSDGLGLPDRRCQGRRDS